MSTLFIYNMIIKGILRGSVRPTLKTASWLLKIMLPVSFVVRLLQYYGVIEWIAGYLDVVFQFMGLPGASSVAWMTGASVSTYAALAVMLSMELTMRQATIIAIMTGIAHALPLEGAVVKKTGSKFMNMTVIRIAMAFVAGVLLNVVLPEMNEPLISLSSGAEETSLMGVVAAWTIDSLKLSGMIVVFIYLLMVVQRLLDDSGAMVWLTKVMRPLMKLFGLPDNAAYLWLVGNVIGLSYGSAMMMELEDCGQISKEEANEVNYHLIMNHSMLEDTLVFVSVGVSAAWILGTRVSFAIALVWARKAYKKLRQ